MENNSLDAIKKAEKEAEKMIEEKKNLLARKKKEREDFWRNKEADLSREYEEKREKINMLLKERFEGIDKELSLIYEGKREDLKQESGNNFKEFEAELFKRL